MVRLSKFINELKIDSNEYYCNYYVLVLITIASQQVFNLLFKINWNNSKKHLL